MMHRKHWLNILEKELKSEKNLESDYIFTLTDFILQDFVEQNLAQI